MHKAARLKSLTGTASARLTPDEETRVKKCAESAGLTKSEWCRQVLLKALDASSETRLLLSELLAMRKVFLTLHTDALQGHELTAERVKAAVEQAESTKLALAENRIQAFRSQGVSERKHD